MDNMIEVVEGLKKALEAGGMNAAPGSLTQGSALQMEDRSPVMEVATFDEKKIKLQKLIKTVPAKGTMHQFQRQLDYGQFGGSAVLEGSVGQEETSSYVKDIVPMAYYVHTRRVTIQATMVQTFDGVKAEDRVEKDAAIKLAADIEFHLFRGKDDFSNAGIYDGNPLAMSQTEPGMVGLGAQIRRADGDITTHDLMMSEYGAGDSVVLPMNGILSQSMLEDVYTRSSMNNGEADVLYMDPITKSAYNKSVYGSSAQQRIVLAGSPQQASGASLNEQWVSDGAVKLESSRFLSAKTQAPVRQRVGSPLPPSAVASAVVGAGSALLAGEVYTYRVTSQNEIGESAFSAPIVASAIGSSGDGIALAITAAAGVQPMFFNVYRSLAGGSKVKFIGKLVNSASPSFIDLGNKSPGGITCFALDTRGMEMPQLSSFKKVELAMVDLSKINAFLDFRCVIAKLPRFSVLVDNVQGSANLF